MDDVSVDTASDPRSYDYSHPELLCDMVMKGGITSGVVALVLGAGLGVAVGAARALATAIPRNGFGLCSGSGGGEVEGTDSTAVPLTDWLSDELDRLSGMPDPSTPVTFGHLWRGA